MKKIKYLLKGMSRKLKCEVIDVLGNSYTVNFVGSIEKYYVNDSYYIEQPAFYYIKKEALENGVSIFPNKYVKVASIAIISESEAEITKIVYRSYLFFKPTIDHTEDITVEEDF